MKLSYDFSQPCTLGHVVSGTGVFNAITEVGRARGVLGSSNAQTRVAAPFLGAEGNSYSYSLSAGPAKVLYDQLTLRVSAPTGTTAAVVAALINAYNPTNPRTFHASLPTDLHTLSQRYGQSTVEAHVRPYHVWGADVGGGTGGSDATEGTATFSGGVDPTSYYPGFAEYAITANENGGLFCFDHTEPLELVQLWAVFSGSVAWALTLRQIGAGRRDLGVATTIDSATGATALVINKPVLIPPGWALGLDANAQGRVYATVRRFGR